MSRHDFGIRSLFASRGVRRSRRGRHVVQPQGAAGGRAACVAEVLEERVLFALAGHPGVSANLSVNSAIRKQQLIGDPGTSSDPSPSDAAIAGRVSVSYDASLVPLTSL